MASINAPLAAVRPATKTQACRHGFRIGLPLALSSLAVVTAGVVDIAMMGHFGLQEFTAVAGAAAVFEVLVNLTLASLVGYRIVAARFAGNGETERQRLALMQAARFSLSVALALAAVAILYGDQLASLLTDSPATAAIAHDYMIARSASLPLIVGVSLSTATFNSHEVTRYALITAVLINASNVVFDLLLIYGAGPAPRLGAVGNGLSTTAAYAIGFAFVGGALRRSRLLSTPNGGRQSTGHHLDASIPRLSAPAMVSSLIDYGSIAAFFAIIATVGGNQLAGARVGFEVMVLIFAVLASFAAGFRIPVGRALGRDDYGEARLFFHSGRIVFAAAGGVLAIALIPLRFRIAGVFSDYSEVTGPAQIVLLCIALSAPFMAWSIIHASIATAAGRTREDMYANILPVLLVQLPLSWLLVTRLEFGVGGAFTGFLAYWIIRSVLTTAICRTALHQATQPLVDQQKE